MIGSHLVELLIEKNADVRIISHNRKIPEELENKNLDIISGDLTDKSFSEVSVNFFVLKSVSVISPTITSPLFTSLCPVPPKSTGIHSFVALWNSDIPVGVSLV